MAKLMLDLEHLRVETFATETRGTQKGTVVGAQISEYTGCNCPPYTEQEGCSNVCTEGCVPPTNGLRTCVRCPHEY